MHAFMVAQGQLIFNSCIPYEVSLSMPRSHTGGRDTALVILNHITS